MAKPEVLTFIRSIDTFQSTDIDTLTNGNVYIIETSRQWFGSRHAVAAKRVGGYAVFDPTDGSCDHPQSISFDTIDFNGIGSPELLVRWFDYLGHSGWENSIHERYGGAIIWDTDSLRILFRFQNFYSFQNWWTTYEADSTGELPFDQREIIDSGGEYTCESYDMKFGKREVTIMQTNHCPDQNEMNDYPVTDKTIYRYVMTPAALVRKK